MAERALGGEWGRSLVDLPLEISADDLMVVPAEIIYARAVKMIAENAPLRIVPGEMLVGSATLLGATCHNLPVYCQGRFAYPSTSHVTLGFDWVMKLGYSGLRKMVNERLACCDLDQNGLDLLNAMTICLDAEAIWRGRYIDLLCELASESGRYEEILRTLQKVPENPPTTFREAIQSLWFMFAFLRLCGNLSGIGRIDEMLGPYLAQDIAAGIITIDEARELVAHFWIKGCEWIGCPVGESGDAQYYQNIVLGGINADGDDVTNDVTYLVLDVVEELGISDFPVAVRIGANTPDALLRRIADVQRRGGGIVSVYGEETVIAGLLRFGYRLDEARRFANDGCWEVQVPGATCFGYHPIDILALLQKTIGVVGDRELSSYPDFESLYLAFRERLSEAVAAFHKMADDFPRNWPTWSPSPLVSMFTMDCIVRGRSYYDHGARYTALAPHASGLSDTGNSLQAIKRIVYEDRLISIGELVECLRSNWEGQEPLRRRILAREEFYGNDAPEADAVTRRVLGDFVAFVESVRERNGTLRPAGASTFGREIAWRTDRGAIAAGRRAGEVLATNFSPSPGTDTHGPTSVIRSYCGMDLSRLPNGAALELKLLPEDVEGEAGLDAMVALLRGFVRLGGFYMQVDVVSNEVLRDAQENPDKYPNLAVRIAGWSARFSTLSREWQDMIINRTQQARP